MKPPTKPRTSARCRFRPGNASNYIQPLDALRPGDRVVLCARESENSQFYNGNLDQQLANLRRVAKQRGLIEVAEPIARVHSGAEPSWLTATANIAKELGASLLAEAPNRFIRHPACQAIPNLQARTSELEDLKFYTLGVRLVTVVPPNASSTDERSYATKRGQAAKGKRGGRPRQKSPGYKKRVREQLKPRALLLRAEDPVIWSIRAIAVELNVSPSTVADWLANE